MDVDKLLQYLIPVIFLIIWAIGKIFAPKGPEQVAPKAAEDDPTSFDNVQEELFEADLEEARRSVFKATADKQGVKAVLSPASLVQKKWSQREDLARAKDLRPLKNLPILNESSQEIIGTKHSIGLYLPLKGPSALKKAFLTCEILGPPLCLRKNGKIGRSWQR